MEGEVMSGTNAYFQLLIKEDGTYIKLYEAEAGGHPLIYDEISNYLIDKRIYEYDKIALGRAMTTLKIVNEVKSYLKDYYTDPNLSLELAAHKVNLSPGYLGKIFKNYTSLSFSDYLNNLRLEKAKVLLSTTNEPASRICEKVGIYNITYFSTLFKKTYGMTPSQFRED